MFCTVCERAIQALNTATMDGLTHLLRFKFVLCFDIFRTSKPLSLLVLLSSKINAEVLPLSSLTGLSLPCRPLTRTYHNNLRHIIVNFYVVHYMEQYTRPQRDDDLAYYRSVVLYSVHLQCIERTDVLISKTCGSATVTDARHRLFSNDSHQRPRLPSSNISRGTYCKPLSSGSSQPLATRQSLCLVNRDGNRMSTASNGFLSGPLSPTQVWLVPSSYTVAARNVQGQLKELQGTPSLHGIVQQRGWLPKQ